MIGLLAFDMTRCHVGEELTDVHDPTKQLFGRVVVFHRRFLFIPDRRW